MQNQSAGENDYKIRLVKQYPDPRFNAQIVKFTQFFFNRSDLHYHAYPECGICLSGSGLFFVEDRIYQFGPGTVTFFPAGMPHIAQSPSEAPSTWRYLWFDEKKLDIWMPEREVILEDDDLRSILNMIYFEIQKDNSSDIILYQYLVKAFARKLELCAGPAAAYTSNSFRSQIMPAIKLISDKYGSSLTTSDLAYACSMSEASFRRAFKNITGESPLEYINRIRITMAQSLLVNTNLSILEISLRCGFPVLSTFNRQFLDISGTTPTMYRTKMHKMIM